MHRSLLLLLVSTLLLSAAVGLPLSLEESAEESWLEKLFEENGETEELLDLDSSHGNSIHKRAAKDSSSSSEEHKDKAKDKADSSSSEEHKASTAHADEESTTQASSRRRRESLPEFSDGLRRACSDEFLASQTSKKPGVDYNLLNEFLKALCPQLGDLLVISDGISLGSDQSEDENVITGNAIHKRAVKDSSSSSEEHKDKAKDKADSSSSEESTTQASARRRRRETHLDFSSIRKLGLMPYTLVAACDLKEKSKLNEENEEETILGVDQEILNQLCPSVLRFFGHKEDNHLEVDLRQRPKRQVSGQKASEELELDAQAEKELDEEMARAVADVKDNGSIEDYAQGCEVMEVSSKEANEATYAE